MRVPDRFSARISSSNTPHKASKLPINSVVQGEIISENKGSFFLYNGKKIPVELAGKGLGQFSNFFVYQEDGSLFLKALQNGPISLLDRLGISISKESMRSQLEIAAKICLALGMPVDESLLQRVSTFLNEVSDVNPLLNLFLMLAYPGQTNLRQNIRKIMIFYLKSLTKREKKKTDIIDSDTFSMSMDEEHPLQQIVDLLGGALDNFKQRDTVYHGSSDSALQCCFFLLPLEQEAQSLVPVFYIGNLKQGVSWFFSEIEFSNLGKTRIVLRTISGVASATILCEIGMKKNISSQLQELSGLVIKEMDADPKNILEWPLDWLSRTQSSGFDFMV